MEKIYIFLINHKKELNGTILAYFLGTITNVISGHNYLSLKDALFEFLKFYNFSIALMWAAVTLLIVVNLILFPLSRIAYHKSKDSYKLSDALNKNTSSCFSKVMNLGGYSWGKDKTLIPCPNVFEGWRLEDIVIEKIIAEPYPIPDSMEVAYAQYLSTDAAKKIIQKKNNCTRWMVSEFGTNFNKTNQKVYISLRKTDWLTLQFFWKSFQDDKTNRPKIIYDLYSMQEVLPNSFCLHLVLVTKNDEVIVTAISKNKSNDYPMTWAATIGEQIEDTDFNDGSEINSGFLYKWIKRALKEEFGIIDKQFEAITSPENIRVLSLNVEGDNYNISLLTVVHMNESFTEFVEETRKHSEVDKEYVDIKALRIKDIPLVMAQYSNKRDRMHPSTYLRLLMCYLHRFGINSFVSNFDRANNNPNDTTLFYDKIQT